MGDDHDQQSAQGLDIEARHAQLVQRDHVVGIEAEIGRQNAEIMRLNGDLRKAKSRASRLRERKESQAKRIRVLQARLTAAREHNARLKGRVAELEASSGSPSLARRIARRLRGSSR